jgi:hypothetical protein
MERRMEKKAERIVVSFRQPGMREKKKGGLVKETWEKLVE